MKGVVTVFSPNVGVEEGEVDGTGPDGVDVGKMEGKIEGIDEIDGERDGLVVDDGIAEGIDDVDGAEDDSNEGKPDSAMVGVEEMEGVDEGNPDGFVEMDGEELGPREDSLEGESDPVIDGEVLGSLDG
jgi:hypothetical protein